VAEEVILPPEVAHLPVDARWKLPVPYIVERPGGVPNFGVLDPLRAQDCYARRLCAMCGLIMGREVALYGDVVSLERGGFFIEAPVHERCAEIALGGLCPFISREHYRRRRIDDPQVAVLGDRDQLHEIGRSIPKRPAIVAIAETYRMIMMVTEQGTMPVYMIPGAVRVRHYAWRNGEAREVPPPRPARKVRATRQGGKQPRLAVDDPAALAWGARIIRAAMERQRLAADADADGHDDPG
jgi:hypothetical protein